MVIGLHASENKTTNQAVGPPREFLKAPYILLRTWFKTQAL
jgi:hypothetical protein